MRMDLLGQRAQARGRLYASLASTLDGGLPVDRALALASPGGGARASGPALAAEVRRGRSLAGALEAQLEPVLSSEWAILRAGERAGTLVAALERLADRCARRAAYRRQLAWQLAYPLVLVHAAVLLPTLPVLVQSGPLAYCRLVGTTLVLVYGAAALLGWLAKASRSADFWLGVPWVGAYLRRRTLSDYSFVLGALVAAGASIVEALESAAGGELRSSFRAAARRVTEAVRRGSGLGQAFDAERARFGSVWVEMVRVGEEAGKLDSALAKAERMADEEAVRAARVLMVAATVAAFLVAGLMVAWVVIGFWSGYAELLEIGGVAVAVRPVAG